MHSFSILFLEGRAHVNKFHLFTAAKKDQDYGQEVAGWMIGQWGSVSTLLSLLRYIPVAALDYYRTRYIWHLKLLCFRYMCMALDGEMEAYRIEEAASITSETVYVVDHSTLETIVDLSCATFRMRAPVYSCCSILYNWQVHMSCKPAQMTLFL